MKLLIHRMFEHAVATYPENTAIRYCNNTITYRELNNRANGVAALLEKVSANGAVVSTWMPSSIGLTTALLAIFKSGRIYLPADIRFAESRIQQILEDVPGAVMLVHRNWLNEWKQLMANAHAQVNLLLVLDEENGVEVIAGNNTEYYHWNQLPAHNLEAYNDEEAGNYIFYTSGSTGRAKAIAGVNKSLAHFIRWEMSAFPIQPEQRVSQLIQFTFDASLRDILLPLCSGATLCIPDEDTRSNIAELVNWIEAEAIHLVHCVPSLFLQLARFGKAAANGNKLFARLKYILLAGEPLYAKDIHRWQEAFGTHTEIVNLYGTSETTLIKTFYRVKEVPATPGQVLPAGQPIDDSFILILNNNRLCRIGEIGEVYIKTPYLTKGYLNNEALTATVFVQNPLAPEGVTDIIYKTGDLGRYLPDRNLEVLGRQDKQVKINGVRIELAEIEKAVLNLPGVEEALVNVIKDAEGQPQLVCYYVAAGAISDIDRQLLRYLNRYMIPSYFIWLAEFPLNANGKVDKRALPAPDEVLLGKEFTLPEEGLETAIADIWKTELGLSRIGREHSFYHLGGNSLKAMKIVADIQKQLNVQLKLTDIFTHPTIAQLAAIINNNNTGNAYTGIQPTPAMDSYAVTNAQHRMWVLSRLEEASVAYHIPLTCVLEGNLDHNRLQQSINRLVKEQESLRTVFREEEEGVRQVVLPYNNNHQLLTVAAIAADNNQKEALDNAIAAFQQKPFDLAAGPLFRVGVFNLGPQKNALVLVMHHIISDGWSVNLLVNNLVNYYNTGDSNEKIPPVQYKDYAEWLQGRLQQPVTNNARNYWTGVFANTPAALELPLDKPRPVVKTFNGALVTYQLPQPLLNRLQNYCAANNSSLFHGLLALINALLYRYTGQTDIVIGTPVANRDVAEVQQLIGFFANTLALRNQFGNEVSFAQLLQLVTHNANEAFAHKEYPFDVLVQELNLGRELSRSPLFDVMMVMQEGNGSVSTASGNAGEVLQVVPLEEITYHSKFDITFSFKPTGDGLELKLEYNTDLFLEQKIQRIGAHLEILLQQALAIPDVAVAKLNLLTNDELSLLSVFSNEKAANENNQTAENIIDRFQQHVRNNPQKVALITTAATVTYQQLDQWSNQLAGYLLTNHKGITYAGISASRNHWAIVAMLGALKAGVAYVVIDKALPAERSNYILAQLENQVLLTDEPANDSNKLSLVNIGNAIAANLYYQPLAQPGELAYICYTSGSTGAPKGVAVKQAAVVNFVNNLHGLEVQPDDVVMGVASLAFDGSVFDIYAALLNGATLLLTSEQQARDVTEYKSLFLQYGVTTLFLPTALFNALIDIRFDGFAQLNYLVFGGEAASAWHIQQYLQQFPGKKAYNGYGPTETTVMVAAFPLQQFNGGQVPIGKPLANVAAFIRDGNQMPVPVGVPGELCIAGTSLAKGYINSPQLQQQRFVASEVSGFTREYKTGDICKWTETGDIVYVGRKDDMLKIRGFLVEPEEIVTRLRAVPSVQEAVVLYRDTTNGKHLVAYIVADDTDSDAVLKQVLQQSLPAYMIPAAFIRLTELPLNNNGKVDKAALLQMPVVLVQRNETNETTALTGKELLLQQCLQQVLQVAYVGPEDNFYEMGGDSIKLIRLVALLRKEGYRLQLKDFMHAASVKGAAGKLLPVSAVMLDTVATGTMPLSPVAGSYFDWVPEHTAHHFNQSVKLFAPKGWDAEKVQQVLQYLVGYHDVLRSRFMRNEAGNRIQEVPEQSLTVAVPVYDLKAADNADTWFVQLADALQAGMDLEKGILLQAAIFRRKEGDTLLLAIHHLVTDGVSWRILFDDFATLYQQAQNNTAFALPEKTTSFKAWVTAQQQYALGNAFSAEAAWWQQVAGEPIAPLPVDNAAGTNLVGDRASVATKWDTAQTRILLHDAARLLNLSVQDVLIAALGIACGNQFALPALTIHLEGHGRGEQQEGVDVSRTIGWFTSIYPFTIPDRNNQSLLQYVTAVRNALQQVPSGGIGYGLWNSYINGNSATTQRPAICLNYLGQFAGSLEVKQEGGVSIQLGEKGAEVHAAMPRMHELELSAMITEDELHCAVQYSKNRFTAVTMQQFVNRLQQALMDIAAAVEAQAADNLFELSLNQQNWFSKYRVIGDHSVVGPVSLPVLDKASFTLALQQLQSRHEILRTSFVEQDNRYYRKVHNELNITVEWQDGYDIAENKVTAYMQKARQEARRQVNIQNTWKVVVIRLPNRDELLMVFSHLIFDGYSQSLLQQELMELYQAAVENRDALLPELAHQYSDFVKAQHTFINSDKGRGMQQYWQHRLSNILFEQLAPSAATHQVAVFIEEELNTRVQQWLQQYNIVPSVFFLALYRKVLHLMNEEGEYCFALPVSNRSNALYDNLDNTGQIGLYSNVVVIPADWDSANNIEEEAPVLQERIADDFANEYWPYECLMQQLQMPADSYPSYWLNYQAYNQARTEAGGFSANAQYRLLSDTHWGRNSMNIFHFHNGIQINLLLHASLYSAEDAREMAAILLQQLEQTLYSITSKNKKYAIL